MGPPCPATFTLGSYSKVPPNPIKKTVDCVSIVKLNAPS